MCFTEEEKKIIKRCKRESERMNEKQNKMHTNK